MKIAILSDIHGNIDALTPILHEIKKKKINVVFSLGDQLGYYYDAQAVYTALEEINCTMIAGNHERIFLDYLRDASPEIDKKYGSCYQKYVKTFPAKLIERIKELPSEKYVEIDNIKFGFFHGSSFDPDFYVYPTSSREILKKFANVDADVLFFGHTHYPFVCNIDHKTLVNVGSVGQSRVDGGIANWGIYDTENQVYIPRNTLYNTERVLAKLNPKDKEKYLASILKRNNFNYE